jgi:hypothetical protein
VYLGIDWSANASNTTEREVIKFVSDQDADIVGLLIYHLTPETIQLAEHTGEAASL